VHVGHIVAAADTRAALRLDRVLMVVAGDPWQKRGEVVASPADRLALVAAAVEDVEGVEPSAVEIERGEPSVTYDTLSALAAPERELFLVLGADAVRNMPTWRQLEETRDLATLVIVERAGDAHAEAPAPAWRVERVTIPRLDIASRDLRARLAQGHPIDGLVPPAVMRAIAQRGLYNHHR
jgi:nicotinate-nucleotide adenylyltransferase